MEHTTDGAVDEVFVREKSTIYAKNPNDYQKAINDASFYLCFNNPSLLFENKGALLEMARKKVHEDGYCYKKGQTRSKALNPSLLEEGDQQQPQPKRQKINAYERQRRIKELNDEISGLNRHIQIKEQRLEQATASRNFKACDEVASEISELKSQRRELNTELAGLQQKSKKASQYQCKKKNATAGDSTTQSGEPNLSPGLPTPRM